MKFNHRSLTLLLCCISIICGAQQIAINDNFTVEELIQNQLISGCVEVSNISSPINGSLDGFNSFGYFERAGSNFPFQNGIVLATGNVLSGGNTQNTQILNEGTPAWGTDLDLEQTLGITGTLNATSIEFEFISTANQISFNYILASEEYFANFPCDYADGFAFLIRLAGTNDPYTNIALVPNTNIPVNTSTIHDEIVGFCPEENSQFFEGYNLGHTNYNGRTTILTASASITPNVAYQIKLVIADQDDENYDSAVFIEGNSFNSTVDLGEDFSTCADTVQLNGDIQNPAATYSWFFNDVLITGANQANLNIIESGNYRVEIEIPFANSVCFIEDAINVTLSSTQTATSISDFEICDDSSGDGIEIFDLTIKDTEVLASVPSSNYQISYHLTSDDAENDINQINNPIQNSTNPQSIFVRIEDIDSGCLAFTSFNLVVNALPNISSPTDLLVCDDANADGVTQIDLTQKDEEITNNQPILVVSYHNTQTDAETGSNAIAMPYVNTSMNEQVFVRVVNSATGCMSTTTLNISVLPNPVVNSANLYIDACDPDHDGFANFNLNDITDEVLQGLTNVNVSFYETFEDAFVGENRISNPSNYENTVIDEQELYIRVEDNDTSCATIVSFEIHTNLLLTGTLIRDFSRCDIDNDGVENFSFNNIANVIINDIPDVTVTFYLTQEDRDNRINPINGNIPFTPTQNPQTIFIELSSPTCTEYDSIQLIIVPIIEFESIGTVDYCDTDQDGFTSIELSSFNALITDGQTGFSVFYFATEEDANNNTNQLPNFYTNISNPQTLYTRIRFNQTGCAAINEFTVNILPAPLTNQPADIIICDDDFDGISIVNLNNTITELVISTNERDITFHNNLQDAESNSNPIANPESFQTSSTTVFSRVENSVTGCFSTEPIRIIINTLPQFTTISNYRICEDNSDGFGDFFFNSKDNEILNGQSGKRVLYFTNQNDADNRANIIDKTIAYQNITNPQTIFVRVENLTDIDCYGTSNFTIEVGTNPEFNEPTDWFVCDDASNDGRENFDLNLKVSEIAEGINDNLNITFHLNQFDAVNNQNAVNNQFSNTVNPQQLFARIDNGTICVSITTFTINVIQAPEVNQADPLVSCDNDYDGIVQFDLTDAANDILDVRQDNIETAYFENLADLEADLNPISDPRNYTNLSNPQIVYFKVTNTISNCYLAIPIELEVNLPPIINTFEVYDICDNVDQTFNVNDINDVIINNTNNVEMSYFTSLNDAENQTNAIQNNYMYQTANDILYARVQHSITQCFIIYPFELNVNPLPIANQPEDLESCDDDYDGFLFFDLSQQTQTILGSQNPNNFSVTYYLNNTDAENSNNNLNNNFEARDMDVIFARVENTSTGCFEITQFTIIINPLPVVEIPNQVICLEIGMVTVSANTNNPDDSYVWSTGETTPEIDISEIGDYAVTVTSIFGCETTVAFNVIESQPANIEVVEIIDFSDPNNITITVTGIGNYAYALDSGAPQESNVFENVTLGYHTITIIDLNGCSAVDREVVVIDAPKFFTPNNDGYFDTWHISGVETLPGTIVNIFDRYGKLLKTLNSSSSGWDGNYNGQRMPTNDYWFVADVVRGNIQFQVKGHFALKR
ncbi:T9SS type B sorting domain-containing protein [Paucihalobacter sp.]|uniref:T9SS type B sorting domain-containing protein n=1 Tax=Paucihalobacter sp. TaxID=2850405 RepID=UPI002FE3A8B5